MWRSCTATLAVNRRSTPHGWLAAIHDRTNTPKRTPRGPNLEPNATVGHDHVMGRRLRLNHRSPHSSHYGRKEGNIAPAQRHACPKYMVTWTVTIINKHECTGLFYCLSPSTWARRGWPGLACIHSFTHSFTALTTLPRRQRLVALENPWRKGLIRASLPTQSNDPISDTSQKPSSPSPAARPDDHVADRIVDELL